MATLTWAALGGDPAPGDPGAFDGLARSFSTTASNAQDAHTKLNRFGSSVDDSIWRGEAADAFRDKIAELPPKLAKLHDSYQVASEGMASYARTLRDLQSQARTALAQGQAAQHDQDTATRRRDQARAADPTVSTASYDQAIANAHQRLQSTRRQIRDLRDRRQAAENAAVAKLQQAGDLGIKNDPWYRRAWNAVDRWVDEHADILRTISTALKWVAGIAGLLSFIPFLAPIFGPIALLAAGGALLLDAALVATGNGDWKALVLDAALMALPGVGRLIRAGGARLLRAARPPGGFSATTLRGRAVQFGRRVLCGDPIDVATGEMAMSETDVELAGALPLVLDRTHVSSFRQGRWFGPSWSSTLDQRLEIDAEGVCYVAADGMILVYPTPEGSAGVLPSEGPRWPLARASEGTYTIVDPDRGLTLHFSAAPDGSDVLPLAALLSLAAVTDRNGNRIDLVYDAAGTLREVRHSGGYWIGVDTSSDGLITALRLKGTDPDNDVALVRYCYDESGRLTEVINSSDVPMRFDYDLYGRIIRWVDRNDAWYGYTYDDAGRCVATSGSGGCLDGTFAYDPDNRITVWTNSLGHARTFYLNELAQVIREVDPLGNATVSEWDRYDRLLARTDPLGRTTRYRYDPAGNLVAVTRPDGNQVTATYNELRLPVTVVDPDGAVWRREYDQRGNLVALIDPAGARTTYDYDEQGNLAAVTDALGGVRRVETDGAGLPVAVTDPLGAVTRYTRDPFGRVVAITDPLGGVTRLGWTVEGKLASRSLPDGATERWTYDGEGNLIEYVDAVGQITRTEIGHFDLPAAETGPDGARLAFAYDTELRLVSVTNPQGLVWRYDYDPAGNLVRETDFNGRELRYVHDPAGQLVERTNGVGQTTHFTRDPLGNVIAQRSGDAVTTFDYDTIGRLVRAVNADADLAFDRDPLGRVVAETCNGRTLTSSYDLLGRRVHRRTPSGAESAWEYGAGDQPVALHTAGHTLRFGYDAAGREVERLLGAGTVLAQTWDANHRLASQTLTAGQARLVQRRSYRYRPDGYVTDIEDHLGGARVFDLDSVGRVTAVHGAGWSERYAYDPAGNITQAEWPAPPQAASLDADARGEREYAGTLIRRAGNVRYEHDAQGRVILRQQKRLSAKPATWRYTWDADDRLVAVTTPDGQRWRYRYDPLGRRIAKQRLGDDGTSVAEQVDFTWDGTVLAEQTHTVGDDGSGRTTVWEWEPGTFRPISQTERAPLRDAPQEWIDEQFYAIVTDLIGTPTELVDPDGNLAWHPRTTLWGTLLDQDPGGASCPLRFPGQYYDPEIALNYNYYRYYDPADGRYQSSDPLGLDGGDNSHAYVPNPMGWIDPLGEKCMENASRHTGPSTPAGRLTASQQHDMAKFVGLKPYPGRSHGQPIFTDGKRFYTYDVDGHNGGLFKVAKDVKSLGSKRTREGTLGLGREAGTNDPWELYRVGP